MAKVAVVAAGLTALLAASCADAESGPIDTPPGRSTTVEPTTTVESVSTVEPPTTAEPTTTTTAPIVPVAAAGAPGHELLFSVATGDGGVTYEGGGEESFTTGPEGLSAAPDGSVWIADTSGVRLLRYAEDGRLLMEILTDADGVGPIFDLAAVDGGVWGWELVAALARDRLVHYSDDGELLGAYELPPGLRLDDGLSGIWVDASGDPWIELTGGAQVFRAFDDDGEFAPVEADGYDIGETAVRLPEGQRPQVGAAQIGIDGTVFELPAREVGGMFFEGMVDGAIAVRFEDVGSGEDGTIDVDVSVWWVTPSGSVLARADYPLDVAADTYVPSHFLSVAPDGRLLAMLPRAGGIDIVVLNAFAV